MFGKIQIKCFYQDYFDQYINSRQIINSKLNNAKTFTQILLISRTSFKFHINSNKSTYTQT
jgi:hypothetical protein